MCDLRVRRQMGNRCPRSLERRSAAASVTAEDLVPLPHHLVPPFPSPRRKSGESRVGTAAAALREWRAGESRGRGAHAAPRG
jgi:hypothetical protein